MLWSHPSTADLDIQRRFVGTPGHIQARVNAILARDFVTESGSTRDHRAIAFDAADVAPRLARAGEADQAESLPELPAKFGFNLSRSASHICAA